MKTLIVGAGIIGTIYGWAFAEAGHDVTHLVRPGRAAALRDGIRMDVLDNRKGHVKQFVGRYCLNITEALDSADGFELIIVPTKAYHLEAALRQIVPYTGNATYLLLTQNWQGTAAVDAILPPSRYLYGDAKAGGSFIDGTLVSAMFPTVDVGQVNVSQDERVQQTVTLFESADIKTTVQEQILHYLWIQYAINTGLWLALVRAGSIEAVLQDRRIGDLALFAVKECLNVVARRGVDLSKYADTRLYTNTSFVARWIANVTFKVLFRYNQSVRRSSAHALGDPREIGIAFYDVFQTGQDLGIPMPVMSRFAPDIERFAGPCEALYERGTTTY